MMQGIDLHERREKMRDESREEVESMLTLAGLKPERMWELANGYWPLAPNYDEVRVPWWLAQTSIGLVRIGRRKRVISINWEATDVSAVVTEDDVTKDVTMAHAWSKAKAVEYLTRLREEAEKRGAGAEPEAPVLKCEMDRVISDDDCMTESMSRCGKPRRRLTCCDDCFEKLIESGEFTREEAEKAYPLLRAVDTKAG